MPGNPGETNRSGSGQAFRPRWPLPCNSPSHPLPLAMHDHPKPGAHAQADAGPSGRTRKSSTPFTSFLIAASACSSNAIGRFDTHSKPIHRCMPHPLHVGVQQRHPLLDLAAGERQIEQAGRIGARRPGRVARRWGVLRAPGEQSSVNSLTAPA